jgi:hypothetical protein
VGNILTPDNLPEALVVQMIFLLYPGKKKKDSYRCHPIIYDHEKVRRAVEFLNSWWVCESVTISL